MGIDTVKLVVPVDPTCSPDALETKLYRESVDRVSGEIVATAHSREPLSSGLDLVLKTLNGGLQAQVEFSVPRFLFGHNVYPASVTETRAAMRAVFEQIEARVPVMVELDDAWISRLDLDRDFYAPGMHAHLAELERAKSRRGSTASAYRDADHRVVSIVRGTSGRWQVTAYDKENELVARRRDDVMKGLAGGRLRVEACLRTPVLREGGLRTVSDITEVRTDALRRKWIGAAGVTAPVVGAVELSERLARAQNAGVRKLDSVLGSLLLENLGLHSQRSRNTQADYRARARKLGLDGAAITTDRTSSSRLDYDLGTLILGEEAAR
jgi:hypothetical protein